MLKTETDYGDLHSELSVCSMNSLDGLSKHMAGKLGRVNDLIGLLPNIGEGQTLH